jgi:hypothetical protein
MRKLLVKLALLFLPIFIFLYFLPIFYYRNSGINKAILAKFSDLYPLIKNKKCIVIAGDSRAERQLIPSIIEKKTGIKTINLAVSSGELISFIPYLKYFNPDSTTFIFSVSSSQTNDGGVTPGYFSFEAYIQLNLFQRMSIFKYNLNYFLNMEDQLIRGTFKDFSRELTNNSKKYTYDKKIIRRNGFLGINKYLDKIQLSTCKSIKNKEKETNHPWYRDINANGYRNKLFQEALSTLGNSKFKIILYQPPVINSFYNSNKMNSIGKFESDFGTKIYHITKNYKNIRFFNFYDYPLDFLNDSCYYDAQHLNLKGAIQYSNFIANKIMH